MNVAKAVESSVVDSDNSDAAYDYFAAMSTSRPIRQKYGPWPLGLTVHAAIVELRQNSIPRVVMLLGYQLVAGGELGAPAAAAMRCLDDNNRVGTLVAVGLV